MIRVLVIGGAGVIGFALGLVLLLALGLFAVQPATLPAAAPPPPWDIELTMTDAFMTARLSENRAEQTLSLRDPKAKFRADGTLQITGTVSGAVAANIILRPTVGADGKLVVDVVSAQLGPLAVPSGLGRLLEGPVNTQLASAMQGKSFRLLSVTMRDGAMTLRAQQERP